jgi:hypothetical protein
MPPIGTPSAASKVAEAAVTTTFPETFAVPVMAVAERGLAEKKQPRAKAPKTDLVAKDFINITSSLIFHTIATSRGALVQYVSPYLNTLDCFGMNVET